MRNETGRALCQQSQSAQTIVGSFMEVRAFNTRAEFLAHAVQPLVFASLATDSPKEGAC